MAGKFSDFHAVRVVFVKCNRGVLNLDGWRVTFRPFCNQKRSAGVISPFTELQSYSKRACLVIEF